MWISQRKVLSSCWHHFVWSISKMKAHNRIKRHQRIPGPIRPDPQNKVKGFFPQKAFGWKAADQIQFWLWQRNRKRKKYGWEQSLLYRCESLKYVSVPTLQREKIRKQGRLKKDIYIYILRILCPNSFAVPVEICENFKRWRNLLWAFDLLR